MSTAGFDTTQVLINGQWRAGASGEKPKNHTEHSALDTHGPGRGIRAGDAGVPKVAGTQAVVRWHNSH